MHKALQQLALLVAFVVLCPTMAWAQTDVVRYSATEYQDRGVVYYLPKSRLDIALRVVKTTVTPGEFSEYAPLLLGQKVATELAVSYEIESAEVRSLGVPDENYSYLVEFKAAQPYSYVALTKNGILSGINGYSTPLQEELAVPQVIPTNGGVDPLFPREFALATSRAKKAQIAANHLFSLREDLMSLLSGKAEFAPREGDAYTLAVSRLEGQIAAVERLFVGTTVRESLTQHYKVEPEEEINRRTIARFSPVVGLLPATSREGEAITLDLKATRRAPLLSPEELAKQERKLHGIIYNLPGSATARLHKGSRLLAEAELPITQFGTRASLANQIPKSKDKIFSILFDTDTGALLSINPVVIPMP